MVSLNVTNNLHIQDQYDVGHVTCADVCIYNLHVCTLITQTDWQNWVYIIKGQIMYLDCWLSQR